MKTVPNGINADSPDAKQTVPDFFVPTSNSKKTSPDKYLTGAGHDRKPGASPGWQVYIQFFGGGRGAGAEPRRTFRYPICSGVSLLRTMDVR